MKFDTTILYPNLNDMATIAQAADKLGKMAVRGQWDEMPQQITDEMLDTFAVTDTWAKLPGKIKERYGDILTRVSYYIPFTPGKCDEQWAATIESFRQLRI